MTYGHPLLVFLEEEGAGFWLIRPEQPEADRFYSKPPICYSSASAFLTG